MARNLNSLKIGWASAVIAVCILGVAAGPSRAVDPAKPTRSLADTKWKGQTSDGWDYTFHFEKDGTLAYTSPSGSFRNGKWQQFGASVYFQMNDHYAEYLGEMDGDSIEGKGWNTMGDTWTWKASRNK